MSTHISLSQYVNSRTRGSEIQLVEVTVGPGSHYAQYSRELLADIWITDESGRYAIAPVPYKRLAFGSRRQFPVTLHFSSAEGYDHQMIKPNQRGPIHS